MEALQKLHRMAKRWGGRLQKVTVDEFETLEDGQNLSEAPFANHLGVNYARKIVYYTRDEQIGELIHEMGHVFASNKDPNDSKEWAFFGWEWRVACRAGCEQEWFEGASNYSISSNEEFGGLSPKRRAKVLAERVAHAKKVGLISRRGVPQTVRENV